MTVKFKNLPQHLAIIMDGNGRWAKERALPRIEGHREGTETADKIVMACSELGIRYLTLYTFSMENWSRPRDEIKALMNLLIEFLVSRREKLVKNQIRFETIGDLTRLPEEIQRELAISKEVTCSFNKMVLTLALSYSARDEIVRAVNVLLKEKGSGHLKDDFISSETFSSYLDTDGMPDPDLLIRTSGEMRISNFLLWQSAYTELFFTETLWPDFGRDELYKIIETYQNRERRFGMTSEQVGA
ncbi:MAG: isoprenyl transferase [bacterium]|nr:isoprenyl transferase [bacterium]